MSYWCRHPVHTAFQRYTLGGRFNTRNFRMQKLLFSFSVGLLLMTRGA